MEFTEELLEKCAEAVHKAYCNYHLQNKGTEYWTKGDYSLLDEPTKQIDRETVKAVFATIKANPLDGLVMPTLNVEALQKREYKTVYLLIATLANICCATEEKIIELLTGYLWDEEEAGQIKRSA